MIRFFAFVLAAVALVPSAQAKLKVVTTTTDFADLARQVGGDRVEVHSVMKGPENVHNVMATPTEMVKLNEADLFVHGGLDAEPWRLNLMRGARNPRINDGQPGNVDMSAGIKLKEVPAGKVDRANGDIHAFGNPHYQLNPQNAQRMTATLTKALAAVDPAGTDVYVANAKRVVTDLAETAKAIRATLRPYAGLKVVTFHRAWAYFADAVPIEVVGTIEPKVGITPSPAQVEQLVATMKQQGVKVVIVETYNDDRLAARVASAAGAQLVRLPDHVLGTSDAGSYQNLFRTNAEKLAAAAKAAGIPPKP